MKDVVHEGVGSWCDNPSYVGRYEETLCGSCHDTLAQQQQREDEQHALSAGGGASGSAAMGD